MYRNVINVLKKEFVHQVGKKRLSLASTIIQDEWNHTCMPIFLLGFQNKSIHSLSFTTS